MRCFVHVGYDPEPKSAESPDEAIKLAEKYLKKAEKKDFKENLSVKWRRDDLYPNNFLDYNSQQLVQYLNSNGQLVLQLAKKVDGLPIMGEIVSIFTADEEERNVQEAERALQRSESHTYKTPISLTATGETKRRRKS
jgi:hypothetical protein